MKSREFIDLIIKYINHDVSATDLDRINEYLADEEYNEIFKKYVEANFLIDYTFRNYNSLEAKKEIINRIRAERIARKKRRTFYITAAAATIALLISLPFVLKKTGTSTVKTPIQELQIIPGSDKAILTLGDGQHIPLEKGKKFENSVINSDGENLVYTPQTKPTEKLSPQFNFLTIPRGGEFHITLADGTNVWLNSASKLKYPVHFDEGLPREVELLYGEAYFDVSPSTEHKGSKFLVRSGKQKIEVIGTEFNIKAYQDETQIYSTLIEGEISLITRSQTKTLNPGQQAIVTNTGELIKLQNVDTFNVVSWRKGVFSFEREPLSKIMKVLSRWYDFETTFKTESLKNIEFTGILDKTQQIEDILLTIKNLGFINAFEIDQQKIILK
ncbi:FecR domain-containing protein [Flavobacteriaceae bacterium F08102]|nr:FecR domain-containing protein [Flavobacteriaceae bacterium F08102]